MDVVLGQSNMVYNKHNQNCSASTCNGIGCRLLTKEEKALRAASAKHSKISSGASAAQQPPLPGACVTAPQQPPLPAAAAASKANAKRSKQQKQQGQRIWMKGGSDATDQNEQNNYVHKN